MNKAQSSKRKSSLGVENTPPNKRLFVDSTLNMSDSKISAKSFYSKPKKYLNPLERKLINEVKGSSPEMSASNSSTFTHNIKSTIKSSKTPKKIPSKVDQKIKSEPKNEIIMYKKKRSSPQKNVNRKFFSRRSPNKSPRKSHKMTLDLGRNLQIQFSNVRRSPRKLPKETPEKNLNESALSLFSEDLPTFQKSPPKSKINTTSLENANHTSLRRSPRKSLSRNFAQCSTSNDLVDESKLLSFMNDENEKINRISPLPESDAESGFAEENSSNANDSPVKEFIASAELNSQSPIVKRFLKSPKNSPKSAQKKKRIGFEQLIIDAGQKDFGAIRCQTCNMVFTSRDPHDEIAHSKFHNMFINTLRFPGWKKEDILTDFYDGRIIRVLPMAAKHQLQKVEELRQLIDTDLGFPNVGLVNPRETHFYLFISSELKKIVGCVIAEPISSAFKVFQDAQVQHGNVWCRAEKPVPAVCGISRIWVLSSQRRSKIASRLIDAVSSNFAYASVISKDQIAFSDPTPDGREFISSYTGTNSFLVYGGYERSVNNSLEM